MSKSDCLPSTSDVLIHYLDKIWDYCILFSNTNKMIFFNPVFVYIWGYFEAAYLKLLFLSSKTLWNFFFCCIKLLLWDAKCLHIDLYSMCLCHELNQKIYQINIFNAEIVLCNKEFWLDLLKGDDVILNQLLILWMGNITGVYFLHKCVIKLNTFIY